MFDLRDARLMIPTRHQGDRPYQRKIKTNIRVGLVDQGVEHFHSFPDAHAGSLLSFEVHARLDIEFDGLLFYDDLSVPE